MQILVTGGAGFIGSHLVDALVQRGHKVRVLDSLIEQVHRGRVPQFLNPASELIIGDVCDAEAVRAALSGVEAVFHQAAEVGVGQSMYEPERYMRTNTIGTTVLLNEIRKRKVTIKKLVVASSMSIYGEGDYHCSNCGSIAPAVRDIQKLQSGGWDIECPDCSGELAPVPTPESKQLFPASVYAVSKQDQEQLSLIMGRSYGVPTVALRYFNGYGTRQALSNPYTGVCAIFCARMLNDKSPLIYEDGKQTRDFVHVSDIVQANLLALENNAADYQAVNVGSGEPITISEIAALLAAAMGKNISAEVTGQLRAGDIRHCVADVTRAKQLLGYKPQVRLADGVQGLIAWVTQQTAEDRAAQAAQELEKNRLVHSATAPAA
jgi:dTDP-L-rhamnose 4-epimerase